VSLIGTLEQFSLSNVLRRIEIHEKTGLLVVKQGEYWVEFYFRNGRLLCIGPLRTQATLGERLVNDRLISPQALHEIKRSLGDAKSSEICIMGQRVGLGSELKPLGVGAAKASPKWARPRILVRGKVAGIPRIIPGDWGKVESGWLAQPL